MAVALALAVATVLALPASAQTTGQLRVLFALTTWGPTPFTLADAERVLAESDAYFRQQSSGRLTMTGGAVGWLRVPRATFDACNPDALRDATPPTTLAGYDRVVFVTPTVPACRFLGLAGATDVVLNGGLFMTLATHELGHTLGLGHASLWDCSGSRCAVAEYGNPFSVMGSGGGDLNAYEKSQLGWLAGTISPEGDANYEIGPVEGPTTMPQALVVRTASSDFWIESRGIPTPSFRGTSAQPAGVAVIATPALGVVPSPYPQENLLLRNPDGGQRYAYSSGETARQSGLFSVTVERHSRESAVLRFQWLDRTAPGRPRLRARAAGGGRVRLTWSRTTERGSGVRSYAIVADGRTVTTIDGTLPSGIWEATLRLRRGWHRVGVFGTDRAGNRGRAATVRLRVR